MKLYKGDCLIESDKIESGSVDLILTDLPYGTIKGLGNSDTIQHGMKGKTEWDSVIDTDKIMQIANRILRKNGKMILTAQHPFTNELINKSIPNLPFSYSMIWEKDHFANALTSKKAPLNYYEDVIVWYKHYDLERKHPLIDYANYLRKETNYNRIEWNKKLTNTAHHFMEASPKTKHFKLCPEHTYKQIIEYFNIDELKGFMPYLKLKEIDNEFKKKFASTFNLWEGKKYKSNILKYKKDYDGHHPTQKPVLLLEDLIKTFSNENDLVVDLTMGSGSTGVAAKNTNRNFIGIEMDDNYFDIATKRINK